MLSLSSDLHFHGYNRAVVSVRGGRGVSRFPYLDHMFQSRQSTISSQSSRERKKNTFICSPAQQKISTHLSLDAAAPELLVLELLELGHNLIQGTDLALSLAVHIVAAADVHRVG